MFLIISQLCYAFLDGNNSCQCQNSAGAAAPKTPLWELLPPHTCLWAMWAPRILCPEELEFCHPTSFSSTPKHLPNEAERFEPWVHRVSNKHRGRNICSQCALQLVLFWQALPSAPLSGQRVSTPGSNGTKDTESGSAHGRAQLAWTLQAQRPHQEIRETPKKGVPAHGRELVLNDS